MSLQIAIADDEGDTRRFYEASLHRQGHVVIASAADGQELVEQCRVQSPDLIITDVLMPILDGINATRQITQNHRIPVIVISSLDATKLSGYGECGHISAFLTKPVNRCTSSEQVGQLTG